VYGLSIEEKRAQLTEIGLLLARLVDIFQDNDSDSYRIIDRLFREQYGVCDKQVLPRDAKEIPTTSLQSAHDEDAAYRQKRDQKVKGYSVNLTETCNDSGVNLITDVIAAPASTGDVHFVTPAIEQTEAVVGRVKEVLMDGGYLNHENLMYAQSRDMQFNYTAVSGGQGRYLYERSEDGRLEVTDLSTGELIEAVEYKPGKYRFLVDGKPKYIRERTVQNVEQRIRLKQLPDSVRRHRNNVEASLFQLSYHTRNNKTRYRGLWAHQSWAFCRAAWMNLIRIKNYVIALPRPCGAMALQAENALRGAKAYWDALREGYGRAMRVIIARVLATDPTWLSGCSVA
jgi:hypothetical protein